MKRAITAAVLGLVAVATLAGATKCDPPPTTSGCSESCSLQPDTVTLEVIWEPLAVDHWTGGTGEATWSKAGVQQASVTHPLDERFHLWHGWEHDWKRQHCPQITLTGDTDSRPSQWGGVHCALRWLNPDTGEIVLLDTVNRGVKAGPGSVRCDSHVGLKIHGISC